MINKIGIHHSASPANQELSVINEAHRLREFNKSYLGYYVGYNAVIFPDGTWIQTRLLGEQTAGATGSNFDTFHICLMGNFDIGLPTLKQVDTLTKMLGALMDNEPKRLGIRTAVGATWSFNPIAVYPHRILQPNHTHCYGGMLADDWGQKIALEYVRSKDGSIIYSLYLQIISLIERIKLAQVRRGTVGRISDNVCP